MKNLQGKGLKEVIVTNRHMDKAEELAKKIGGRAVPFAGALNHADNVDIIITATGASQYIVKAWDVRNLMMKRNTKPLVAIDIAVPCDIEPEVGTIRHVTLYNIDDLQDIVESNIRFREGKPRERSGLSRRKSNPSRTVSHISPPVLSWYPSPIKPRKSEKESSVMAWQKSKASQRKIKEYCSI